MRGEKQVHMAIQFCQYERPKSGTCRIIAPIPTSSMTTTSNALDAASQAEDDSSVPWGRGELQSHLFDVIATNNLTGRVQVLICGGTDW